MVVAAQYVFDEIPKLNAIHFACPVLVVVSLAIKNFTITRLLESVIYVNIFELLASFFIFYFPTIILCSLLLSFIKHG